MFGNGQTGNPANSRWPFFASLFCSDPTSHHLTPHRRSAATIKPGGSCRSIRRQYTSICLHHTGVGVPHSFEGLHCHVCQPFDWWRTETTSRIVSVRRRTSHVDLFAPVLGGTALLNSLFRCPVKNSAFQAGGRPPKSALRPPVPFRDSRQKPPNELVTDFGAAVSWAFRPAFLLVFPSPIPFNGPCRGLPGACRLHRPAARTLFGCPERTLLLLYCQRTNAFGDALSRPIAQPSVYSIAQAT